MSRVWHAQARFRRRGVPSVEVRCHGGGDGGGVDVRAGVGSDQGADAQRPLGLQTRELMDEVLGGVTSVVVPGVALPHLKPLDGKGYRADAVHLDEAGIAMACRAASLARLSR